MFRTLRLPFLGTALAVALASAGCVGSIGGDKGGRRPAGPGGSPARPGRPQWRRRSRRSRRSVRSRRPGGTAVRRPRARWNTCPLRRLTRTQYNNTVRDLLGVTGDAAAELRPGRGGGRLRRQLQGAAQGTADREVPAGRRGAGRQGDGQHGPPGPLRAAGQGRGRLPGRVPERLRQARLPPAADRRGEDPLQVAVRGGQDQPPGLRRRPSAWWCRTMLQSPHFLYRPELGDAAPGRPEGLPLTGVGDRLAPVLLHPEHHARRRAVRRRRGRPAAHGRAGVGSGAAPAGHAPGARDRHQLPRAVAGRG